MTRQLLALLGSVGLLCVSGFPARAQGGAGGPFRRFTPASSGMAASPGLSLLQLPPRLQARIQITAEQKKGLDALRRKLQQELLKLPGRNPGAPEPALYRSAAAAREQATRDAQALLTSYQQKLYHLMEREYRQYEPLGRPALALLSVSGLSDDQKTALRDLVRETQAQRQDAFRGLAERTDPQSLQQAASLVNARVEGGVRQILTVEQQKELDAALRELPFT